MQDNSNSKRKSKRKDPIEMLVDKVAEKVFETVEGEVKSIFKSVNTIIENKMNPKKNEAPIKKEPKFTKENYVKKSEDEKRFENAKDITPKKMRRRM